MLKTAVKNKWVRVAAALAAAGGLVVGGVSIAEASIPSADGAIHGCLSPGNASFHELSVIDPDSSGSCPSGWDSLNWSPGFSGAHFVTLTWNQLCAHNNGGDWQAYAHKVSLASDVRGLYTFPDGGNIDYGTNTGTNPSNNVTISAGGAAIYTVDSNGNIDGLNAIGHASSIYSDQASCQAVSFSNKVLVYAAP